MKGLRAELHTSDFQETTAGMKAGSTIFAWFKKKNPVHPLAINSYPTPFKRSCYQKNDLSNPPPITTGVSYHLLLHHRKKDYSSI